MPANILWEKGKEKRQWEKAIGGHLETSISQFYPLTSSQHDPLFNVKRYFFVNALSAQRAYQRATHENK